MKKVCVFLLLAFAFTACQKKQYFTESPEIELVKKGADSYLKADWAALSSLYADTAKVIMNSWTKTMTVAEFIEAEKQGVANYTSYKIEDGAIYESVITDKGESWVHTWLGHTATLKNGKTVTGVVHIATQVLNGKVVFQVFVFDNLQTHLAMEDSTAGE